MNPWLGTIHIVVSVTLISLILLQSSKGGFGGGVGGGEFYRTKRGAERVVFNATIIFSVIFLITSIASVIVR